MNTQPDKVIGTDSPGGRECTSCGRSVYSGLPRCAKCQTVYLDGYDEGFNEGIKAGQYAFESTLNMIFGKAESK